MRWTILLVSLLTLANATETSDAIKNETTKDMICVATYQSIYTEKIVDGKKKRVQIHPQEEIIKIIKPKKSFRKKREGYLHCFNELVYIKSRKNNNIEISNERTIKGHITNHNLYDITVYENKDINYVGKYLGIAQACGSYKGGKYCNQAYGLDIYYDKNDKVKNIYLYGNTVQKGKLPFTQKSIFKLRNNEGPLGLWVIKNYKKLFSKKPSYTSKNLIIWTNLSKYIKQVTITPKNGYFKLSRTMKNKYNLFKDGWTDSENAIDYIQSIEVEYQ